MNCVFCNNIIKLETDHVAIYSKYICRKCDVVYRFMGDSLICYSLVSKMLRCEFYIDIEYRIYHIFNYDTFVSTDIEEDFALTINPSNLDSKIQLYLTLS